MAIPLIKTTITIPADLVHQAKRVALEQETTLSNLIRDALKRRLHAGGKPEGKEPTGRLGVFRFGSKNIFNQRSDIYYAHLRRKLGV